jgi:8-oxo-dGTP diphosphatase
MIFEVIVRALIHDGGKVLIGRKRGDVPHPLQGQWHLVGGRLEYDENPWTAITREVEEEVGIKVKPIKIVDVYPEFLVWPEESGVPSQYTLHIIFECIPLNSEIKPGDDVEEVKWVNVKRLKSYIRRDSLMKSKKLLEFLKQLKNGG